MSRASVPATQTGLKWSLVLRSLLIQGSWNYRTFLGAGVAWALLPVLRRGSGADPLARSIARQSASFNAHPYLTPLALGAFAKLESEGADGERTRRFRDALRSPLGSLGDVFIWGAWRPLCLLAAILAGVLGLPPLVIVAGFLVIYNVPHLLLRIRGAELGLALGFGVGEGVRRLALTDWTERTSRAGVLCLGLTLGLIIGSGVGFGLGFALPRVGMLAAACACFIVGFVRGESLQRWGPVFLLVIVAAAFAAGALPGYG